MATIRFSVAQVASRAFGMEAVAKFVADTFGFRPAAKTSRFEQQRIAVCKREIKKWHAESFLLLQRTSGCIMQAGRYQSALIDRVKQAYTVYAPQEVDKLALETNAAIEQLSAQLAAIRADMAKMEEARRAAEELNDERSVIQAYSRFVAPYMAAVRRNAQKLAAIVA